MTHIPTDPTEIIEFLPQSGDPFAKWQPIVGTETVELVAHLNLKHPQDKEQLQNESVAVLSKCLPPSGLPATETGLVIGYVQSGKTMSFTTVAALAKDNGYRLIVVITGITTNLFEQSCDRLVTDIKRGGINRRWRFFENPRPRNEELDSVAGAIDWDSSLPSSSQKTVLIMVMKNARHLQALNDLLTRLHGRVNMNQVPTLIIDDEADQASLNNKVRQGGHSSIYTKILELRDHVPHHSFLQYTATPQAPLLINLIDVLSPNFAELLSPGTTYTGGTTFFEGDFNLIKMIPQSEVPTKQQPLTFPPDSLLEAMHLFFLGVAVGFLQGDEQRNQNRSMMVHPSKNTAQHADYTTWVRQIKQRWDEVLSKPESDPDRQELKADFETAYKDLANTTNDIPSFNDIHRVLRQAIKETQVTEANAARGKTPQLDWEQVYSHIVVGGEVLNRGYTLQGLTVTYMPRGKGVGNADTVQQRARWFGYKADYLGYCRVFLDSDTFDVYRGYVEHEEHIRKLLRTHQEKQLSLKEWRRAFFIDPSLRPTRSNVLDKQYTRGNYANKWFTPSAPHDSLVAVEFNQQLVQNFLSQIDLYPDKGHDKRTEMQRHLYSPGVELEWVYQSLLTQLKYTYPKDSYTFTGALLQIERHLEQLPNSLCTIYLMSKGTVRVRSVKANEIPTLFQGANPDKSGKYYPGDNKLHASSGVTIQIHILNILSDDDPPVTLAENVPALAVWIPKDMEADWLVQENH